MSDCDPEDFDKFLEEIKIDASLGEDCDEGDDSLDSEDETDSFIKELGKTKKMREVMHSESGPVSSTPKIYEKLKSRILRKSEGGAGPAENFADVSQDAKRAKTEGGGDQPDDSKAEKDITLEKVKKMLDKSSVKSGNIGSNDDDEYDYILNSKELDDSDDGFAKELTIDDWLELEGLLDSEDLDITVIEKEGDDTLTADTEDSKVKKESSKPANQSETNTQKKVIDKKELKNIARRYHNKLKEIYIEYLNEEAPPFHSVREPRIFKDKSSNNIIGYEELDEYLDNNHPLWTEDRMKFGEFLHGSDAKKLADYIGKKWNSGLHIDLCQNLSCIPKIKYVERDQNCVYLMPVEEEQQFDDRYKDDISVLVEMNETIKNTTTVDQEQLRLRELKGMDKKGGDDDEVERDDCKFCSHFCTCGSQRTIDKLGSRKRKRTGSEGDDSKEERKKVIKKKLNREEIVRLIYNQNRKRKVDEIARIVKSAEDVMDFNYCFTNSFTFSRQMLLELVSLEDVYKGFEYYYSSPYGQNNKNKGKAKAGDHAKKPVPVKPVKEKAAANPDNKKSPEGNYQKFIEDY